MYNMEKKMPSKLKKLKMPEMEMDELEGMSDEESPESEEAPMPEPEAGVDLEGISDEELMAELRKRGLSAQMEEPEA